MPKRLSSSTCLTIVLSVAFLGCGDGSTGNGQAWDAAAADLARGGGGMNGSGGSTGVGGSTFPGIDGSIDAPLSTGGVLGSSDDAPPAFDVGLDGNQVAVDAPGSEASSVDAEAMDWTHSITDYQTTGSGVCSDVTVFSLLQQVASDFVADGGADITYRDGGLPGRWIGISSVSVGVLRYGDGFRIVKCMAVRIASACDYYATDADCVPVRVGSFSISVSGAAETCSGVPLWGYPRVDPAQCANLSNPDGSPG